MIIYFSIHQQILYQNGKTYHTYIFFNVIIRKFYLELNG